MSDTSIEAYKAMLFALTDLKNEYGGTPEQLSQEFFKALAQFGPEYITGDFSMTTDTTSGEVNIKYTPPK